mmetsp:Transcript_23629/g.76853  ORF Transcript_23629/g.76853 Transcript_23629/m.76853 type:complete len:206 (-) Transcript_23629:676-1293(-)
MPNTTVVHSALMTQSARCSASMYWLTLQTPPSANDSATDRNPISDRKPAMAALPMSSTSRSMSRADVSRRSSWPLMNGGAMETKTAHTRIHSTSQSLSTRNVRKRSHTVPNHPRRLSSSLSNPSPAAASVASRHPGGTPRSVSAARCRSASAAVASGAAASRASSAKSAGATPWSLRDPTKPSNAAVTPDVGPSYTLFPLCRSTA